MYAIFLSQIRNNSALENIKLEEMIASNGIGVISAISDVWYFATVNADC